MEASIEHLRRGTVRHAQTLLIVVEPYYRALETAGRIAVLAPQLGIPSMLAIGNKVRSKDDERAIRSYCAQHGIEVGAVLPFDDRITAADRQGTPFLDYAPDSPFVERVQRLADRLATSSPAAAARAR